MIRKILFAVFLLCIFAIPTYAQVWTQINSSGFGDVDNSDTWKMIEYNGYLYASTYNSDTGCEVWRTQGVGGPPYADWQIVNSGGFGDADVEDCISMAVYNGYLYVGTSTTATRGGGLWRTAGVGGPPFTDWTQVNTDGFGDPDNALYSMAVYNGYLYVGAYNSSGAEIWRTAGSGGIPYTDWFQVNTNGFGDTNNEHAFSMTVYNGSLFVGTGNSSTGGEVWRTTGVGGPPFTDWMQVNTDGFGDSNNSMCMGIAVYNNFLFIGTANGTTGGEVWRTTGVGGPPFTDWTQVNTDGFGDSNNDQVRIMAVYNGYLFAGTENGSTGGEVWRTTGVGGPPYTDWTQVNTDGFGSANNSYIYSMAVYNGFLYAGTSNSTTGTEIWAMQEADEIPTLNEWGMIIFVVLTALGAMYYIRRQKTAKS